MPIENMVQSEKTVAVMNSIATSQSAQRFFSMTVTAVTKLSMPIKPK